MKIISSDKFETAMLDRVRNRGKMDYTSVSPIVKQIIAEVKEKGDAALLHYTEKFDNVRLSKSQLKVSHKEILEAYNKLDKNQLTALQKATDNITLFHQKQLAGAWSFEITKGLILGQVRRPLSSIGVYTPGGKATYPSTVLMCVIPAKIAGVKKIVVCSPPGKKGNINPALLVAADIAGASEIFRVGGAQAIAAMAYGTATVPKSDKIVGPGNIFILAAKMEVSKDVAIDIPAGPSEILILADEAANATFIAADLLAQAEHDSHAWAILLTTSKDLALAVTDEIYRQLPNLSRKEIIQTTLSKRGLIIIVKSLEEAIKYANFIAPEHLHIHTRNPQQCLPKIQNAGAIFIGEYAVVAFGDYSSGLNHVLPTGGYAAKYSGLSTSDFVKTINVMHCNKQGYLKLKNETITLANMEGLDGHAASVLVRGEVNES